VAPPWKRDPQVPGRLVYQPKASRAETEEATRTWKAPGKTAENLKAES
jgi:hypothetical protein